MRKLSRSSVEFFANNGWSANKFLPHAEYFLQHFTGQFEVGRTVAYIGNGVEQIEIRPHYAGRSNEWITLCKGDIELHVIHCSEPESALLEWVVNYWNM